MNRDSSQDNTGEELYRMFLSGDESAFEALVALYRDNLTRFIYSYVNDARDAEDLMIDAFAELAVSTKFNNRSSLKTYLFAIGRNLALRHLKKYRRSGVMSTEEMPEEPAETAFTPEMDFLREDERLRLHTAMHKLKLEYREILHLLYFENMSYAQAGHIMKKSFTQVNNLAHRSKAALKKILENSF